jgi:hypothetical protein
MAGICIADWPETEFWEKIHTKVFRVSSLLFSHLYSFALRFIFLQTHATSYSFYSSVHVHCKGERRKPERKPYPRPYSLGQEIHTKTSSLRTIKIMPRNLNEIVHS